MAAIGTNYTVYVPGKPLNEQLERLSPPTVVQVDMAPMITGAPLLTIQQVDFKSLKINDRLFNISLQSKTTPRSTPEGIRFYEVYIFRIRNQNGQILHPEVSVQDIETTIRKIYNSTKKGI